jgi:hypothetical protein
MFIQVSSTVEWDSWDGNGGEALDVAVAWVCI